MEVIFKLNYFVSVCIIYVLSTTVYIQVYKLVFIVQCMENIEKVTGLKVR